MNEDTLIKIKIKRRMDSCKLKDLKEMKDKKKMMKRKKRKKEIDTECEEEEMECEKGRDRE